MYILRWVQRSHTFPRGYKSINNGLCCVEEVSVMCLPDDQVSRALYAEAILKPQHCLFIQWAVSHL